MSIYAQGFSTKVLLGTESAFRVPGTTAVRLPIINPSVRLNINRFRSQALTGVPEPRPIVDGKQEVGGNLQLECSIDSLMLPLYALFGGYTAAGAAPNIEHEFYFADQPYMFVEQQHLDITQFLTWKGMKFGRGQFRFEREGLMQATFDVIAASQEIGAATIVSGTVRDDSGAEPFDYTRLAIKQGGTAITYLQSVTLDVNRNPEGVSAIDGTVYLQDVITSLPAVTGTITALFKDAVLLNLAGASTETSLELAMVSGSLGYGMVIELPISKLMPSSPTVQGQGVSTIDFTFDSYARGSASNVSGQVASKGFATQAGLSGLTLEIEVDGAAAQTVTFGATDDTLAEVVAAINTQTTGCTASALNGRAVIKSDTKGSTSSIEILAASTADVTLGFDNTLHAGYDAKSILWRLSNSITPIIPT